MGNFARHCFGGSLRLANDDAQDDFDLMMTFLVIWMLIFNDDGEDHLMMISKHLIDLWIFLVCSRVKAWGNFWTAGIIKHIYREKY